MRRRSNRNDFLQKGRASGQVGLAWGNAVLGTEGGYLAGNEEGAVAERLIQSAASAYRFPLIIKHILNTPLLQARGQEIVYRGEKRFGYAEIWERINRLSEDPHI